MSATTVSVGDLLREWRVRRRLSQLSLALDADVSPRHLSFVETGRAQPSRDLLLRLAERLEVPLRDRNALLLAAGFAPGYPERSWDDPAWRTAREAVDGVLRGHEPYPALAIDRHWTLLAANRVVPLLLTGVEPDLLAPPVNVIRLSLHPAGLAPRIENLHQWRTHLVARLRRQVESTADPVLADLLAEVLDYEPPEPAPARSFDGPEVELVVPLRLRTDHGSLALISTTMVFGSAVELTLAELAIESFFPANATTAETLYRLRDTARRST